MRTLSAISTKLIGESHRVFAGSSKAALEVARTDFGSSARNQRRAQASNRSITPCTPSFLRAVP